MIMNNTFNFFYSNSLELTKLENDYSCLHKLIHSKNRPIRYKDCDLYVGYRWEEWAKLPAHLSNFRMNVNLSRIFRETIELANETDS